MTTNDSNEHWIEFDLIPKLIKSRQLTLNIKNSEHRTNDDDEIKVKNCLINQISTKEVFMLTKCYRVKIILTDVLETIEECIGLVVKVN